MKKILFIAAVAAGMIACTSATAKQAEYQVTVNGGESLTDGDMVYLFNYDTQEKVDSVAAANGSAVFTGTVEEPFVGRLISGGSRMGTLIVEGGNITVADNMASGTPLNDVIKKFGEESASLEEKFSSATTPEEQQKIYNDYIALNNKYIKENAENPVGYLLFSQMVTSMSKEELDSALAEMPKMADYKRIQNIINTFERQEATAPGKMFTDFEIEYNGEKTKLSDFVGKGNYTLVDFWASWCGPCRREAMGTLKDIYNQYNGKGLDIVGIAVWDEPENTLQAINEMQLPWKQVLNAQTVPTDLYGILGIPCIILFGPDGTIVARDQQGADLKASVDAAMANAAK